MFELIQVCTDLTNLKTFQREVQALSEAMEELKVPKSAIVSLNEERAVETNGNRIDIVPAWKWLSANDASENINAMQSVKIGSVELSAPFSHAKVCLAEVTGNVDIKPYTFKGGLYIIFV